MVAKKLQKLLQSFQKFQKVFESFPKFPKKKFERILTSNHLPETDADDDGQREHLGERERVHQKCRPGDFVAVDEGEEADENDGDQLHGLLRRITAADVPVVGHECIVGERECGDRISSWHDDQCGDPEEQKGWQVTERLANVRVIAARFRNRGAQLGVAQSTDQREQTAAYPNAQR